MPAAHSTCQQHYATTPSGRLSQCSWLDLRTNAAAGGVNAHRQLPAAYHHQLSLLSASCCLPPHPQPSLPPLHQVASMADTAARDTLVKEPAASSKSGSANTTTPTSTEAPASAAYSGGGDPFKSMAGTAVPRSPGGGGAAGASTGNNTSSATGPSPDRPLPAKKVND